MSKIRFFRCPVVLPIEGAGQFTKVYKDGCSVVRVIEDGLTSTEQNTNSSTRIARISEELNKESLETGVYTPRAEGHSLLWVGSYFTIAPRYQYIAGPPPDDVSLTQAIIKVYLATGRIGTDIMGTGNACVNGGSVFFRDLASLRRPGSPGSDADMTPTQVIGLCDEELTYDKYQEGQYTYWRHPAHIEQFKLATTIVRAVCYDQAFLGDQQTIPSSRFSDIFSTIELSDPTVLEENIIRYEHELRDQMPMGKFTPISDLFPSSQRSRPGP